MVHTATDVDGIYTAPNYSLVPAVVGQLPLRWGLNGNPHKMLYAGEWQNGSFDRQRMFLLDRANLAWSYQLPWAGEFGQVTGFNDGNVMFARYAGATEIARDGRVVWNFDAPPGTELHTCRPVDDDKVFIVLNGSPAKAMIIAKDGNAVEVSVEVPTAGSDAHAMFRSADYTAAGTFLLGHMDRGLVVEYAASGDVVWQLPVESPWGVTRLRNGNTLVSGDAAGFVREYSPDGDLVWEFSRGDADAVGINLFSVQQSQRLANGNTIFANWCSAREPAESMHRSVQLLEVTRDKQLAWRLSQWQEPNLGPASFFHIFDEMD